MNEAIAETSHGWQVPLTLRVRGGLHARPAAKFAQEAQRFHADIRLETEQGSADAKSMLDVLSLAVPCDAQITLSASGSDARCALETLSQFLQMLQD